MFSDWGSLKRRTDADMGKKHAMCTQGQRFEQYTCEPRKTKGCHSHQKLEEAREDSSLEASERGWSCYHLDVGLLTSRTVNG